MDKIIIDAERAIKQIEACGIEHSAKYIKELIRYTKALEKNQQALIVLVIKLQRINKRLNKIMRRISWLLNRGQRNILDVWLKEGDKNDPA